MTKPKRICMVTHSFYESDNRVLRYAESLAERGDEVEVFALRRRADILREEVIKGVRVYRIQDRFGKEQQSKSSYLWPLLRFAIVSSLHLAKHYHRAPYDLVHVHNIPDFLVFAAWYPKLRGARVILDIHDIVPEFFASKFAAGERSRLVRALKIVEKLSAGFADHVILANHLWLNKFVTRSTRKEKCSVVLNHVDARIFRRGEPAPVNGKPVILFPGGLQWHQGLDVAIRAFDKLRRRLPTAEFHIYGEGNMKPKLQALSAELGLNGSVRFFDPLPLKSVAQVMGRADLGVVAKRADSFGNEAYSTKIMEFMSLGVPVVVSNTKIDRHYFDDSVVRFFESGNDAALADAMYELLSNEQLRSRMVERASEYANRNSWQNHKAGYLALVDSLCGRVG